MSKAGEGVARVLGRLVFPERVAIRAGERATANARLVAARTAGVLSEDELVARRDMVAAAVDRADLRAAVGDLPGAAVAPGRLVAALRVVSAATLALFAAQFTVWATICVFSLSLQSPWWLFTTIPGAAATAILAWAVESCHRAGQAGQHTAPLAAAGSTS
jgi:hypothetical protein